ncbi:putative Cathepsin B [Hypsibius exemplaris]|uniref:Cathepsin B n=1 Tax=Hypsibius exemplaris TaxID=2072580 RepID=A0A1W0X5G9_HYPEX|nr:putative Cathepsin B [Hypsibius exemplaris]
MNSVILRLGLVTLLLVMSSAVMAKRVPSPDRDLDDDHIAFVNQQNAGKPGAWFARKNFHRGHTDTQKRAMLGARFPTAAEAASLPVRKQQARTRAVLPATFDARTQWPSCTIIADIRNQGQCGSCWANVGASVISDRNCIASPNKNVNFKASVADIMNCNSYGQGCGGGYVHTPFMMWATTGQNAGVVSGGEAGSNSGCKPYTGVDAVCSANCSNTAYTFLDPTDKHYGSSWYYLRLNNVAAETPTSQAEIDAIRTEIMTYGSISAGFSAYRDIYSYASGVYTRTTVPTNDLLGGHALTIIGWGTEGGVDYWLAKNSWGTNWGAAGLIKFRRGINHCGIESQMAAGLPLPRTYGYDRCDALFCSTRANGNYYVAQCSKNYCSCSGGVGTWVGCAAGSFVDKTTNQCVAQSATFCPSVSVGVMPPQPAWPAVPQEQVDMCNQVNCDARGTKATYFPLGRCSPYWCYCYNKEVPTRREVVTCGPGQFFDFRSEVNACADMRTIPGCY